MTTVIGIFDSDSDLEVALNRLYDKGVNDVRVVDRTQRTEAEPTLPVAGFVPGVTANNSGATTGNGFFLALLVPGFLNIDDERLNSSYVIENLDIPMSDEEADFYANAIRGNGKLLVVDTDSDHADMVWSIMRNSNASQYTRPEKA